MISNGGADLAGAPGRSVGSATRDVGGRLLSFATLTLHHSWPFLGEHPCRCCWGDLSTVSGVCISRTFCTPYTPCLVLFCIDYRTVNAGWMAHTRMIVPSQPCLSHEEYLSLSQVITVNRYCRTLLYLWKPSNVTLGLSISLNMKEINYHAAWFGLDCSTSTR